MLIATNRRLRHWRGGLALLWAVLTLGREVTNSSPDICLYSHTSFWLTAPKQDPFSSAAWAIGAAWP
jgi:hypothetical protein